MMRFAQYKTLFTMLILTNLVTPAYSFDSQTRLPAGGVVTGGGSSVVRRDGTRRLADFIYAGPPLSNLKEIEEIRYSDLPEDIRQYMEKVEWFLKQMGVTTADSFFEKYVRPKEQKPYLLVPPGREDNTPCRMALPNVSEEVDEHSQYGCTFRGDTYILTSRWQSPASSKADVKKTKGKLAEAPSTLHKTMRIIHERLWAAFPKADQKDLSAFAGGLESMLLRFEAQQKGDRSDLDASTQQEIHKFYEAAIKFGMVPKTATSGFIREKYYRITSGGAIVIGCPELFKNNKSFLSLGTRILTPCGQGSLEITNSEVIAGFLRISAPGQFQIVQSQLMDVELRNSNVSQSKITESFVVESGIYNSTVDNSEYLGPARIVRSRLKNVKTIVHSGHAKPPYLTTDSSDLTDTKVYFDARILYSDIRATEFSGQALLKGTASERIQIENFNFKESFNQLEAGARRSGAQN